MRERSEERRSAFLAWLDRTGLNVARVARQSGVPKQTIYSFVQGRAQSMKATTEAQIADAYHLAVDEIFGRASPAYAGVVGKVGARAEVYPLDEASDPQYEVPLPPGLDPGGEYIAFEIEGFSMPPARPGWVVIFRAKPSVPEDMLNYPVLVDLEDGRRLFKILRKGFTPGRFTLESWDGSEPIEDVELRTCLPFVAMTPGRMAR